MKFAFVEEENTQIPVATLCGILRVSRSGYYAWLERPESVRAQQHRLLRVRVRASFETSRQRYVGNQRFLANSSNGR